MANEAADRRTSRPSSSRWPPTRRLNIRPSLPVRSFDKASITEWATRQLALDAEAYTDGLVAFRRFVDTGHAHTVLETGGGRAATEARGARWVNVLLSNVKPLWVVPTTQSSNLNTRVAIWAKPPIDSTAGFVCQNSCRNCYAPWLSASLPEPLLRQASNFLG